MIAFASQFEPTPSLDDIIKLAVAKMIEDMEKQDKTNPYNWMVTCPSCGRLHKEQEKCPSCGE